MRQKRKKKFMYVVIIQFIAVYCGLLFWTLKFNSQTSAAFNDVEYLSFQIAADWSSKDKDKGKHDKSSLRFIKQEVHCYNGLISAIVQNASKSSHMKNSAMYAVYWSDKGKPKPEYGGQKLHSGTVPALRAGETFAITVKVTKPGHYVFKVNHSGYDIWSETLQVDKKCVDQSKPPKGKHESSTSTDQVIQEKTLVPENSTPEIETNEGLNEPGVTEGKDRVEGDEQLDESHDTLD